MVPGSVRARARWCHPRRRRSTRTVGPRLQETKPGLAQTRLFESETASRESVRAEVGWRLLVRRATELGRGSLTKATTDPISRAKEDGRRHALNRALECTEL